MEINTLVTMFNKGFLSTNKYEIDFNISNLKFPAGRPANPVMLKQLSTSCKSFSIPNITINTSKKSYNNSYDNIGTGYDLDNIEGTFLVDGAANSLYIIDVWLGNVFDLKNKKMKYAENYKRDITIAVYNKANDLKMRYTLIGAFPINKSAVPLSYDNENSMMEVTVSFSYDTFKVMYRD